jgi:hypothetical protein
MTAGNMRPKHVMLHLRTWHTVWLAETKGPTGAPTLGKVYEIFKEH